MNTNLSSFKLESTKAITTDYIINCDNAGSFLQTYVYPVIYYIGSIFNILCAIVLYLIVISKKKQNENSKNLFEILFAKSLSDSLLFTGNIFSVFYYCNSCDTKYSLVMQIWNIAGNIYLTRVTEFYSINLEILASLELLLSVNSSIKSYISILKHKYFYRALIVVFLPISFGLYTFLLFEKKIVSSHLNGSLIYSTKLTEFGNSNLLQTFELIHIICSKLIQISTLIVLNFFLIRSFEKMIHSKYMLTNNLINKSSVRKLQKSNMRRNVMIIITNLSCIIFHASICIYHMQFYYAMKITCFRDFSRTALKLHYLTGFFVYLNFNRKFRQKIFKTLNRFKKKIVT